MRRIFFAMLLALSTVGSSFAMMGQGGGMGGMGGSIDGGMGSGMHGAGGMASGMFAQTLQHASLDVLTPITSSPEALAAVQNFLQDVNSGLKVAALWEYGTAYKAELMDTSGQYAFDLVADKLTGSVLPEMGVPMIMNASYGKRLQKTMSFGRHLNLTADEATAAAQAFVTKNATVINYNLSVPEVYPGYYKFHTSDTLGKPGDDILVNGYNGNIWMNTLLGAPLNPVPVIP